MHLDLIWMLRKFILLLCKVTELSIMFIILAGQHTRMYTCDRCYRRARFG